MVERKDFSMKRALPLAGLGWLHQPDKISGIFKLMLEKEEFQVDISKSLDTFHTEFNLNDYQVIIPNWTMGQIPYESLSALLKAAREGVGIAGIHGGMGDAFRNETEYQFMVGGQFVAHPGGQDVIYTIEMVDNVHIITKGVSDFTIKSELYYMHIDPAIHVVAATKVNQTQIPVAWTKKYENGKVFYCSIGHKPEDLDSKDCYNLVKNGILWATS
jgi:type 1 glutamine amidotransferase